MTPGELATYTAAAGALVAALIRLGTWVFGAAAARNAERRVDLTTIITRQDEELRVLRIEIREQEADCDRRINGLSQRVQEAERARAQMEHVLYRMGWSRGPTGKWDRQGGEE